MQNKISNRYAFANLIGCFPYPRQSNSRWRTFSIADMGFMDFRKSFFHEG